MLEASHKLQMLSRDKSKKSALGLLMKCRTVLNITITTFFSSPMYSYVAFVPIQSSCWMMSISQETFWKWLLRWKNCNTTHVIASVAHIKFYGLFYNSSMVHVCMYVYQP